MSVCVRVRQDENFWTVWDVVMKFLYQSSSLAYSSARLLCHKYHFLLECFNTLMATLKPYAIRWLVHWPLMGGLLHLVQRGGAWAGCGPAQSPLAVPNVTAHPSTASAPIPYYSMWHYSGLWILKGQYRYSLFKIFIPYVCVVCVFNWFMWNNGWWITGQMCG